MLYVLISPADLSAVFITSTKENKALSCYLPWTRKYLGKYAPGGGSEWFHILVFLGGKARGQSCSFSAVCEVVAVMWTLPVVE